MKLLRAPAIKLPTLSKREVVLVALFLLASLTVLYYKFVFEPQWENIAKLQEELKKQQQELNLRLSQGWSNIAGLRTRSQSIEAEINRLYLRVTNYKDEPALLADFYNLARLNNVQAETINFSKLKEVKGKFYSTFNVTLEITGYNQDIYDFILALEKYPRLNRMAEIEFKPLTTLDSSCKLVVEFYVLGEVQQDPDKYSFMNGVYGKDAPYKMFNIYQKPEENPPDAGGRQPHPAVPGIPGAAVPQPVPHGAALPLGAEPSTLAPQG